VCIIAKWRIWVNRFVPVANSIHFSGLGRFTAIFRQDLAQVPTAAKAWILADQTPI
jgi:hypothetical protein